MIELIIMLGVLAAVSFAAGVLVTRELCHMALAQQKDAPNRQDFDADKWNEHYKEITGITEMEGR